MYRIGSLTVLNKEKGEPPYKANDQEDRQEKWQGCLTMAVEATQALVEG